MLFRSPGTLATFDYSDDATAWIQKEYLTDADVWSYDMSATQFDTGGSLGYKLELYAKDKAGNQHTNNCPWVSTNTAGDCQTGSDAGPKYVRYFKYDKYAPNVSIAVPAATSPNNIGSSLATISGPASDAAGESGISTVTYTLKYGNNYWNGAAWQGTAVSAYAGGNCAGAVSCTWSISGVAWQDSQNYDLTVHAVDAAGNASDVSQSFNYDASAPETQVTTAGGAMNARLAAIAGTAVDRISSYTASGLDGTAPAG